MATRIEKERLWPAGPEARTGTLDELLRERADATPARLAYTFLDSQGDEQSHFTYAELDRRARSIAAYLQSLGVAGERVLLLYPPGLDYVAAFFGCLYAKAVAVPAYPPRLNQSSHRLQAIAADARPALVLTTGAILARSEALLRESPEMVSLRWLATDMVVEDHSRLWRNEAAPDPDRLAFLQYTSGSTGNPRGVMVSHRNLLHNQSLIRAAFRQSEESVIVGWLPLYHDMGLIGNVLQPLFVGAPCVLMSPMTFLQNPLRWLEAISRYRATTSGGPNFAYELCVRKIGPEARAALDLSRWDVAFNGAEPVRASTLERFAATFAECGFRREAFQPCYGLAEATLLVTAGRSRARVGRSFATGSLRGRRVSEADEAGEGAKAAAAPTVTELVGCGAPDLSEQRVLVVDPETHAPCEPEQIGEVWVAGRSVADGYWGRPEETARTFEGRLAGTDEGPFLRTGDLGFYHRDELFITGRLKDLIIIRGLNHYPQDIEATVEACSNAMRPGCGAAFSVEAGGEERLVIVQEVDPRRQRDAASALAEVRRAISREHELQPYAVVLLRAGTVPKTSSGKVRRSACREMFLADELTAIAVWRESQPATDPRTPARPLGESAAEIEAWLVERLAAKTGVPVEEIEVGRTAAVYGLDSLAAIELVHEVEGGLGVSLPLNSFLGDLSVARLAVELEAQLKSAGSGREGNAQAEAAPQSVAVPAPEGAGEPLSLGQQTIWFFYRLAPESPAYNVAAPLKVAGPLDPAALGRACAALVERHPSLRTTFDEEGGEPVQRVQAHASFSFEEVDAAGWGDEAVEAYLVAEAHRPFDLERGPLLRVRLLRRTAESHVLMLVAHHIVVDFWSLSVLMHELDELYGEARGGRAALLAQPTRSYADFVRWQREMLAGPRGALLRDYWEQQMAGEPPALDLPADRTRPAEQTFHGASELVLLDEALTRRLDELGRARGATLYMTLLGAFQVLLHRYTGQEDFFVGSPTSGRSRAEWARVVGYFVNPVALRASFHSDPTFGQHLAAVRRTVLDALEHEDYPFSALVESSGLRRDLSRPLLFQVMFVMQKGHLLGQESLAALTLPGETGAGLSLADLELEALPLPEQVAQFDLTLSVARSGGGLAASLQYNADLFDRERVRGMLGHFRNLLAEVVADPERHVSRLDILGEDERRLQLVEWNQTRSEYSTESCAHELFEAQAEKNPQALAVTSRQERLTYEQLNRLANRLAHRLRRLGVGPETPVCVLLESSPEMVVSVLAVLKAGGAYVPLDPAYPRERLAYMISDSAAPVVITRRRDIVPRDCAARVLALDEDWDSIAVESEANPPAAAQAGNLAYVIYTSGSTGRPKGVCVTHGSLLNLVTWHQQAYGVTSGDRATQLASPAFDASVWELWPYLTAGASVHIPDEAGRASAAYLWEWIVSEEITVCFLPTPLAEALIEEVSLEGPHALRALLTGGDKLQRAPRSPLPFALVNHYGPTECTVVATRAAVAPDPESDTPPPIGRPVANTRAYVLDTRLGPVPSGARGELYLGGDGLARGYLGRPSLTAERFVPDPFSTEPGARLYRTGDVVRHLSDGRLEFVGRADHQVKVRGFRIELGEIEAALLRHEGVRDCVVAARGEGAARKVLVAYVVARDESATLAAAELRSFLKEKLPDYMIPQSFVPLAALPLTPNGKVDRAALPEPAEVATEADGPATPLTPVEELLAGIWARTLGVAEVRADDNFFELGGHSLLAAQVAARVRQSFPVELPLRSLFETPTLRALAAQLEEAMRAGGGRTPQPPLVAILRDRPLPLSPAQQRLWFLDRLEPNNSIYNLPAAVLLRGALDLSALTRALNEIVRRHEVLRTTFVAQEGRPAQFIASSLELELPLVDLSALHPAERESEAARLIDEEAHAPFDLAAGPLLRTRALRLGAEEHVLLFNMHHIVSDGWSVGVLVRELRVLYEAYSVGGDSPLPELTLQYADFADWQQQLLADGHLEEALAYWRERLRTPPAVLELPTDRPRPAVQTYHGASETVTLPAALRDSLKRLSLAEGVTLYMTMLAAFKVLLARHTGQNDITVGAPVAGRDSVEVEHLIGFFVNTLVLRTDLSGDPTFGELLGRVRETALGAYLHQNVPFEKLVEEMHKSRDLSHPPLFQVMFAMNNAADAAPELPGLSATRLDVETRTAKFDLLMYCEEEEDGGLKFRLEYNTDLFDRETARLLLSRWENLLAGVAADPAARVSALPLMGEEERQRVLEGWNDTAREYAGPYLIHAFFEQQSALTPEAVAVRCGREQLTYAELNARANRLARHLRELGVGPEVLVGVLLERSLSLPVALLAVLKAGGAYVPLDPAYPAQRMSFIIEDTRAPVLLTQSGLLGHVPPGQRCVLLDRDGDAFEGRESGNLPETARPDHLAYVIYTSGSTGRPKGVAIAHSSAATFLHWSLETFGHERLRGVAASTSICFDLSVYELFAPLACGGTVLLVENALHLSSLPAGETVTLINTVPSAVAELLRMRAVPPGVKTINLAGEALPQALVNQIFEQESEVEEVWNLYGPSEDTTYSTGVRLVRGGEPVSIGRPVANTRAYVLDTRLGPVPSGARGELYLGGDGLARGYLGRPSLTAERFVPDPFSTEPGARLYRTGDVVRHLSDGRLEFVGRADHQVKVRGFRIELGEIEAALLRHEGLERVVVMARGDARGSLRIVAYVVGRDGASLPQAEGLRAHLRERLPEYMLPSAFVPLAALPLTPNGKVDRAALPEPDELRREAAGEFVAPRNATEEALSRSWGEVLGLKQVGVHDNFFELGGHSLLATQAMSKLTETFGLELPLRALFESPTVAGLAAAVEAAQAEGAGARPAAPSIRPVSREAFRTRAASRREFELPEALKKGGR
jgi:amino acid adenylation domain-containing protein